MNNVQVLRKDLPIITLEDCLSIIKRYSGGVVNYKNKGSFKQFTGGLIGVEFEVNGFVVLIDINVLVEKGFEHDGTVPRTVEVCIGNLLTTVRIGERPFMLTDSTPVRLWASVESKKILCLNLFNKFPNKKNINFDVGEISIEYFNATVRLLVADKSKSYIQELIPDIKKRLNVISDTTIIVDNIRGLLNLKERQLCFHNTYYSGFDSFLKV